jgi:hypothetical protein
VRSGAYEVSRGTVYRAMSEEETPTLGGPHSRSTIAPGCHERRARTLGGGNPPFKDCIVISRKGGGGAPASYVIDNSARTFVTAFEAH